MRYKMKTGIVILNYNDYENTINFIKQIKNYKMLDEIVIVDNNSNDDSIKNIKPYIKENITLIEGKENKGYAYGNNLGLKYLEDKCDIVFISNPDIDVKESVINELIKTMKDHPEIAILAPNVIEHNIITRGWKCPDFWSDWLSNFPVLHRYQQKIFGYKDNDYQDKFTEVEVIKGCFFLLRMEIVKRINFFDENTFLYYEENILGKKLKDLKQKSFIQNDQEVIHQLSASVDKSLNSLKKYKILKNSQGYYQKEYNKLNLIGRGILIITWRLTYAGAFLFYKIRGGK